MTWRGWAIGLGWIAAVAAGQYALVAHQLTPGPAADAGDWPAGSTVAVDPHRPTVMAFLHPHCPCAPATLESLAALAGRECRVVVFLTDPEPAATRNGKAAAAIPGVEVRADADGAEARRFGAATSGQAFVFAPGGRLRFRGGLTNGRGHAGDSPGRRAALAAVAGEPGDPAAPVFGCPLRDE
jgi:hypothetical protein